MHFGIPILFPRGLAIQFNSLGLSIKFKSADEVVEGSWFTKHIKTLPKVRLERSTHGRGGLIKVSIRISSK